MRALKDKARTLLAEGTVQVVIGEVQGSRGRRRLGFLRDAAAVERLVADPVENLAATLSRPEIRRLGRPAVVANLATLRSLLQLHAERQLQDGGVVALVADGEAVAALERAEELEAYLALKPQVQDPGDAEAMARLSALSQEERWAFWQKELSRCVKCYACRESCPMCYCGHCTMDCNRPQWVPVASHGQGNLEYHLVRAMHLAGRCVSCGACGRACPVGIPVHLLAQRAEESARQQFGSRPGVSARLDYALSTFKLDDHETFIR